MRTTLFVTGLELHPLATMGREEKNNEETDEKGKN